MHVTGTGNMAILLTIMTLPVSSGHILSTRLTEALNKLEFYLLSQLDVCHNKLLDVSLRGQKTVCHPYLY